MALVAIVAAEVVNLSLTVDVDLIDGEEAKTRSGELRLRGLGGGSCLCKAVFTQFLLLLLLLRFLVSTGGTMMALTLLSLLLAITTLMATTLI